jgi:hypothetical protein
MIQTLILHNYHPVSVNTLLSLHPCSRGKIKRGEAAVIAGEALAQGIAKATGRRRISIRCEGWPRGKLADSDNLRKVLLDICVSAGLLLDDGPAQCEQGPLDVVRAQAWTTTVVLEDL